MKSEGGVSQMREAYDALDYELVEVHDNLTVPSSAPAWFDYCSSPAVSDAVGIEDRLNNSEFAFIDVTAQNGEHWYEFNVSGTAFGESAEDRAKVKISTAGVSVFQDREEKPTWGFFSDLVLSIEQALGAELERRDQEDE